MLDVRDLFSLREVVPQNEYFLPFQEVHENLVRLPVTDTITAYGGDRNRCVFAKVCKGGHWPLPFQFPWPHASAQLQDIASAGARVCNLVKKCDPLGMSSRVIVVIELEGAMWCWSITEI